MSLRDNEEVAMNNPVLILHLEDDSRDAEVVRDRLEQARLACELRVASDRAEYEAALAQTRFDLILSDYKLPSFDGMAALALARAKQPEVPFILISGTLGEEQAVDCMLRGATDYLLKQRLDRLVPAVLRALAEAEERRKRREAEESVRASEVKYRRLFEAAQDGVLILDAGTGTIVDVNPFLVELLGFSRKAFLGKKVWELGSFKDIVANQTNFAELQKQEYIRYRDKPLETAAGLRIDVEFVSNVYLVNGQKVIQCNIRDISARKRAEEKLRLAGEELLRANGSLVERNTEIQNFYHTLSHELKTPLTSAREFISILIDGLAGPLNETQLEYLGIAKESCDQLRLYINDLLDVTRLETGKMSIEFRAVALAALVEHVVNTLAPAAKGKNLRLSYDCQPDLPDVPLDQQRIAQVLTNLTTNALKFTPAGGQIHISVSAPAATPEYLQVAVRDTGRGIPGDQLDLIFNRLHQADRDDAIAESRTGLGLGLYICKELVQLHGGRIWAESELGQGSTFIFTIPRHQTPASHNVLVVDDDPLAIELVCARLEPEHYHVTSAGSGMEALEQMHRRLPDVVLMDLQMPQLDGAATLKEIRKVWDGIPVILHTAYTDSDQMMRALKESPFTVLAKPYAAERLLEAVRAAVASQEPRRGNGSPARPLVSARELQPSPGPAAEPLDPDRTASEESK
jgi:PAS domain S-box-containing protein